jgi:type I restriction enzyme R subunit
MAVNAPQCASREAEPVSQFTESEVEEAALGWLEGLGYAILAGPAIAVGEPGAERRDPAYRDVVLERRLREAVDRLNPELPAEAVEDAVRKLVRADGTTLLQRNRAVHRLLVEGVPVEYARPDGTVAGAQARVLDFDRPEANDWLAVNQLTVAEGGQGRRPDVVVFVNGLPLAVVELKNPADEGATVWAAFQQLETYQAQVPGLFAYNAALVASDGVTARIGVVGAGREWFKPWRTIGGREDAAATLPELQVVLEGVFEKRRFLDLVRHFLVFEDFGAGVVAKKMAGYHQFHAVNVAVEETRRAALAAGVRQGLGTCAAGHQPGGQPGDRRVGVVWHTQGSGKSLAMAFYAGRVILDPAMENPTIVVLTDRNDLDDQLFGTFARCRDLLRQAPVQAVDRADLRAKLSVASGGVVFTTIQKFFPEEKGDRYPVLSDRRNIVVIADEAHRSQYDFIDGYARHMRDALPNASFIGFTGTPIEHTDANTRAIFGDYISIYDIQQAVEDGATVRIYYEGRLAKLELDEKERPKIDPTFDEVTEGEELEKKEKLKTKWAALEAIVGTDKRIGLIARDFIEHFEKRLEAMEGKAMIVGMSRRICVDLYNAIIKLRPDWHSDDDRQGVIKIVMTGNATDPLDWQKHVRTKARREELAKRFKNPDDPFKIVIVRDMWLTGFDVPPLHTMYLDKPMQGHGLMQAIARVNRVYKDKPGGLIVDYLGLAYHLQKALAAYTEAGHPAETPDQDEAVNELLKRYEICKGLFYGFDRSKFFGGTATERIGVLPLAQEHILGLDDGKKRLLQAVRELSLAFALAVPDERALAIRDDVSFFQAVRAALIKSTVEGEKSPEDVDQAIRQILSRAVAASDQVIDIFAAAGLKKPEISILSEAFLAEVRDMPQRNLAIELLRKLLNDELKSHMRKNLVQSRSFTEMLERTIRSYQNRTLESAEVIAELIKLAEEMREAQKRGEQLKLTEDEIAFYDALEVNDSAVKVLGDDTLKSIARELVETVRNNATIDWTVRETVRAKLRVMVKRVLRKYGYPPDKQERATKTVLEQAELIAGDWAG